MQREVQGAVERETREGGVGPRSGGAARQGGQDGTHHGALRDRFKTVCEVSRFTIQFLTQFSVVQTLLETVKSLKYYIGLNNKYHTVL